MPDTLTFTPFHDEAGVLMLRPETETVPEAADHAEWVSDAAAGMAWFFRDRDDVSVHNRLAWFPDAGNTRIRLDPDVMVVVGRAYGSRRSFKDWMEEGVVPALIIEVASEDDTPADYRDRLARMREFGVPEVVLIYPHAPGGIQVLQYLPEREDSADYRVAAMSVSSGDPVEVRCAPVRISGGEQLKFANGGEWLGAMDVRYHAEAQTQRAEAAHQRAEVEHQRAEAAQRRAEAEKQRADRLAAKLRELGVDPEAL